MSELRFDGRVVIVTGAGGNPGLGRSYAMLLASRGAKVVVNDLGVGPDGRGMIGGGVERVVQEINDAGGEAVGNGDTVATPSGARAIVDSALERWGRVDILINNAGIAPFALFDEISEADIEKVVGVHLFGHIWMCRAAWQPMKESGYGRLVNISSEVAVKGLPYQSVYSAAKLGVVGLTRSLAAEGHAYGIRANALMPAADTLAWQTMLEPSFSEKAQADGLTPESVAPVGAWLAHEGCEYSGKIFQARRGSVKELFFATTRGIDGEGDQMTLDSVAARASDIVDHAGSTDAPDPHPGIPGHMKPKQYSDAPRN
ncbi:SDR family NAD(P)-dependent oxidoreductase [Nocardia carnea]|uniref:SDR family NAD(P)-dependent oxidoreductase n=1 Tax=Nocardia carnea TaxID=37328 RepID=UPI0024545577|nr:SDR family NAD(P)-dependent oxidoreductase [Nocardia carnea]